MKSVKIGIAYEGGSDGKIITEIARKVFESRGYTFDSPEYETPATGLLGFIVLYTKRFAAANVDVAIFSTDQDKDLSSRRENIIEKVRKADELMVEKTAIAIPDPHIEKWLLLQDQIIKNILCIPGNEALKHGECSPKEQLLSLYEDSSYDGTVGELKLQIVSKMDIEECSKRDNTFRAFVRDIQNITNILDRG